ncbi:hypothetical protein GQ607_010345 [Colletotrichum asianum]|uniref:Uncharacterized protein n=1 Tax=Colletotrichum asianum TaxID=702518 RepID=A0A8H3WAX2_9PEZI|nr:hypothetical protein GQ607_010345 [Colletotrichum asianum]
MHLGAPLSHQAFRIGPDHANPSTCSRKLCVRSNAKWPVLALFDMCPVRANRAIRSMTRLHIHLSCQQSPSSKGVFTTSTSHPLCHFVRSASQYSISRLK